MSLPSINSVPDVTLDETQKARLLELVAEDPKVGTVNAAREAGVVGSRAKIREAVAADDELTAQLEEARGRGPETIRAEIKRRAIDGIDDPMFHDGAPVYSREDCPACEGDEQAMPECKTCNGIGWVNGPQVVLRKYSDRMLAMMAKANLPEYQDADHVHVEVTGAGTGPIQVEGRAVVGLADVVALARELGVGSLDGVDAGPPRGAVPAAQDVLPDPRVGELPASPVPPARPD